jgi:hypothetical protein
MADQPLYAKPKTVNGYTVGTTDTSAVNANTADTVSTQAIGYPMGGKKVIVGIDVKTGYDDVVAILAVQGSHDGTTWVTLATAIADTTPDVTGVKQALVDLTAVFMPYYRLLFNSSGLNVNTAGKCQLFYATIENSPSITYL